jgi:ribosome-binding factor A
MGKASDRRLAQVSSLLLRTLVELIHDELKDPRLELFSLIDVRLAKDLTTAVIKVSTLGDKAQTEACCKVLNSAAPLLWNRLRRETDLRTIPKLHFEPDFGGIYEAEIDRVLRTLPPMAEDQPELSGDGQEGSGLAGTPPGDELEDAPADGEGQL